MGGKARRKVYLCVAITMAACLSISWGCHFFRTRYPERGRVSPPVRKLVVVGFKPALSPGKSREVVRNPLSGATFGAEPVAQEVGRKLTNILFERLVTLKKCEFISPGQARGAMSSIFSSDVNVGMDPLRLLQELGKAFGADAVLAGYIYRWRNREGTDYGVNRPASVAFDLLLIGAADGTILWRANFDKTQRSLSENLFDMATFMQTGGRWVTAERLALMGLNGFLARIPLEWAEEEGM